MAVRISTGLRDKLLGKTGGTPVGYGFGNAMDRFFVDLYSGTQPASPDNAPTGTLLMTYTLNGAAEASSSQGGTWNGTVTGGKVTRTLTEVMMGTAVASGNAGWGRIRLHGDSGASSVDGDARIDFSVGTSGADLNLASVAFVSGTTTDILGVLSFTLPMSTTG